MDFVLDLLLITNPAYANVAAGFTGRSAHKMTHIVGKHLKKKEITTMAIINMTPHPVNIVDGMTIPASGQQIRLAVTTRPGLPIDGVPTSTTVFGDPVGLPDYQNETFYIVSQLVKSACPGRTDLLVPAEVVRDEQGRIIGCRSLGR